LAASLSDEEITNAITKIELELLVKFNVGVILERIVLTPKQLETAMFYSAKHRNINSLIYLRDRKHADLSYLGKYISLFVIENNIEIVKYLYDNKIIKNDRQYPNLLNEILEKTYLNLNNLDYLIDNNIIPKKLTLKTMCLIINKYRNNPLELFHIINYLTTKMPEISNYIENKYNDLYLSKKK